MSKIEKSFPTGKEHVSFSEIKCWKECSYRHKLSHIDKVDIFEPSPYLDFGTTVHEGCETLLERKKLDGDKLIKDIFPVRAHTLLSMFCIPARLACPENADAESEIGSK